MNLVLDIGNSSAKFGTFKDNNMIGNIESVDIVGLHNVVNKLKPENIILSAVSKYAVKFPSIPGVFIRLTNKTKLPVTLNYDTPGSLGVDRIAAAVGASVLHPENDSLIIDAGSCITYDLLENGMIFQGGIISPGVRLRAQAMHSFTKDLPLIDMAEIIKDKVAFVGKSTIGSMQSGVLHGLLIEIDGLIDQYSTNYPGIRVFLCGGEAKYFEKRLKADIFAVPELVLVGLNKILEHNISNESVR